MLFVLYSIHESLHDDREQYRTTTQLLLQTYLYTNSFVCRQHDARESCRLNMQARTGHVAMPAGVIILTWGHKLFQTAMMRAAAAVGKTAVSAPRPHSPVTPAEQSAPLGRRVSGDGVLRADCTK